jgi:hypothetical protein
MVALTVKFEGGKKKTSKKENKVIDEVKAIRVPTDT